LEIAKTVGLALRDFHFGVGAFGDAIVAIESPHGYDLLRPKVRARNLHHEIRQQRLAFVKTVTLKILRGHLQNSLLWLKDA
jgi:hypothetical protein